MCAPCQQLKLPDSPEPQVPRPVQEKPRMARKTKAEASGLSEADQIAMQDRMFAEARARAAL